MLVPWFDFKISDKFSITYTHSTVIHAQITSKWAFWPERFRQSQSSGHFRLNDWVKLREHINPISFRSFQMSIFIMPHRIWIVCSLFSLATRAFNISIIENETLDWERTIRTSITLQECVHFIRLLSIWEWLQSKCMQYMYTAWKSWSGTLRTESWELGEKDRYVCIGRDRNLNWNRDRVRNIVRNRDREAGGKRKSENKKRKREIENEERKQQNQLQI